ncbi:hypothetical protein J1N35_044695 [Gossypium stocksii]|uniref:Uncharacterized protein n=1 Tax=Gossypium stocksii TaxID=47602 RepID=A0A9D3UA03_9ROSI|nr:hypothetical protein J1N35_044695 [Gossypium stocksii]
MEVRSRQLRQKRQQRVSQQRKFGRGVTMGSSSTLTQHAPPMSTLIPYHFTLLIPVHFTNPMLFFTSTTLCTTTAPYLYPSRRYIFQGTSIQSILRCHTDIDTNINANTNANTNVDLNVNTSIVMISESMPTYPNFVTSTALDLSMDESNGDENEAEGGDVAFEDMHEGGDEDDEHEDDGHNPIEELTPLVVCKNHTRNHQPSLCGTHSARRRQ